MSDDGRAALKGIDGFPWAAFAQPEGNDGQSVPRALRALAACASKDDHYEAYNRMLYALGNNHAGTYCPAVLPAVAFLGEILERGGEWPRIVVLDVLTDLVGSFVPERGFDRVTTPEGETRALRDLLLERVSTLAPRVQAIAADPSRGAREDALAAELLEYLSHPPEELEAE